MQSLVEVDKLGLGTKEGAIGWQNIARSQGAKVAAPTSPGKLAVKGNYVMACAACCTDLSPTIVAVNQCGTLTMGMVGRRLTRL